MGNSCYNNRFNNIDFENIYDLKKECSFCGLDGYFMCTDVYDGDTITIQVPMIITPFSYVKDSKPEDLQNKTSLVQLTNNTNVRLFSVKIRIYGIDAYEVKLDKKKENPEKHKKKGLEGKKLMENLVLNKVIYARFMPENSKTDMYGRVLAEIFSDGKNVGDILLAEDLAVEYYGGTKTLN